jgi:uncharacterized ion transporter superfamily protein YfcC
MNPLYRAITVAAITLGASVVGMALQWVVPADVFTASKGSVGAMVGLVTRLRPLVLSLLVFTAFSVFTTQQSEASRRSRSARCAHGEKRANLPERTLITKAYG